MYEVWAKADNYASPIAACGPHDAARRFLERHPHQQSVTITDALTQTILIVEREELDSDEFVKKVGAEREQNENQNC